MLAKRNQADYDEQIGRSRGWWILRRRLSPAEYRDDGIENYFRSHYRPPASPTVTIAGIQFHESELLVLTARRLLQLAGRATNQRRAKRAA